MGYVLRPYALQRMLRGCNLHSSRGSWALPIQQNLTGLPAPYRQAAIALSNWVLADKGSMAHGHGFEKKELHDSLGCLGGPRPATAAADNEAVQGSVCPARGRLLRVELAHGTGVLYTV